MTSKTAARQCEALLPYATDQYYLQVGRAIAIVNDPEALVYQLVNKATRVVEGESFDLVTALTTLGHRSRSLEFMQKEYEQDFPGLNTVEPPPGIH